MLPAYTDSHVLGAEHCTQICGNVASCVAATINVKNGECLLTSECHQRKDSPEYMTLIKRSNEAGLKPMPLELDGMDDGAAPAPVDDCSYCKPQNPCEQARLCRSGQCFQGLALEDGKPCENEDTALYGGICIKGKCRAAIG